MNRRLRRWHGREQAKIARRLERAQGGQEPRGDGRRPEFRGATVRYEGADRVRAMPYGGLGMMHDLARQVGLVAALDAGLNILKQPRPYFDSDHVLNLAYNALCGGQVLEDIEIRRNDAVFLDALGARSIPDPTTAGDYCRRFAADDVQRLMDIVNEVRLNVWRAQPASFLQQPARIDADGTLVKTTGECKQGMDISYKADWGYHPLLVSLANTGEPLFIANRPGNRPSAEGAEHYFDRAIALCRRAGFKDILLRGDTDFSLTRHFDRWTEEGVRFVFGYDAHKTLVDRAVGIDDTHYTELLRRADEAFADKQRRAKPPRIKQQIVEQRGYRDIQLIAEHVAEFDYTPTRARQSVRIIALRKETREVNKQCTFLLDRYHFYVTNDPELTPEQVVAEANQRCNQENLIEQLKNGPRALRAPLNTLDANWAYMVIVSLAWTLKAWFALSLPTLPRWRARHEAQRERVLRMDFRTFVQRFILIPVQVLQTGRRLVLRLLAWRPEVPILLRLAEATGA